MAIMGAGAQSAAGWVEVGAARKRRVAWNLEAGNEKRRRGAVWKGRRGRSAVGGGSAHVARSAGGLPRATFIRVSGDAPGMLKVLGLQRAKSTPATGVFPREAAFGALTAPRQLRGGQRTGA